VVPSPTTAVSSGCCAQREKGKKGSRRCSAFFIRQSHGKGGKKEERANPIVNLIPRRAKRGKKEKNELDVAVLHLGLKKGGREGETWAGCRATL